MVVYIYFKRNNKRFTKIENVNDIKNLTERFIVYHDGELTQVPKKSFKLISYGR